MLTANIEDGPRGPSSKHSLWLLLCRKWTEWVISTFIGPVKGHSTSVCRPVAAAGGGPVAEIW